MSYILIEFECRTQCEAYPNEGETPDEVIVRGDFQATLPTLVRWRTYELSNDDEAVNFGEWHESNRKMQPCS